LPPLLIHRKPFKINIPPQPKLRLDRSGDINRTDTAQVGHAILDDLELDGNHAGHLDGAAKRDLPVALRKVQVADGELGPLDVHRQIHFGPAREVLDVAVAAVLGPAGDGARAFEADLFREGWGGLAGVDVHGFGTARGRRISIVN
jgi:hypothetical protein